MGIMVVAQDVPDALSGNSPSVAILNEEGTIVWVNPAWEQFGAGNGLPEEYRSVGKNYLAVTRYGNSDHGRDIGRGIKAVLDGERMSYTAVYPCHSPADVRWFQVCAARISVADRAHCAVIHQNVTELVHSADGAGGKAAGAVSTGDPQDDGDRLVRYSMDADELILEGLIAAFESLDIDLYERKTPLIDWVDIDAVQKLYDQGNDFSLSVHVWTYPVVITPESVEVYAPLNST